MTACGYHCANTVQRAPTNRDMSETVVELRLYNRKGAHALMIDDGGEVVVPRSGEAVLLLLSSPDA